MICDNCYVGVGVNWGHIVDNTMILLCGCCDLLYLGGVYEDVSLDML